MRRKQNHPTRRERYYHLTRPLFTFNMVMAPIPNPRFLICIFCMVLIFSKSSACQTSEVSVQRDEDAAEFGYQLIDSLSELRFECDIATYAQNMSLLMVTIRFKLGKNPGDQRNRRLLGRRPWGPSLPKPLHDAQLYDFGAMLPSVSLFLFF